jgi:Phage integrase family
VGAGFHYLHKTGSQITSGVKRAKSSDGRPSGNRLFLYTQQTGVRVHTIVPEFVATALERTPRASEKYHFWTGRGLIESAVRSWQTRLRKLFKLAGLTGHSHRFRDTFAVELLMARVPIERASILLGYRSVRVTDTHYNPWVYDRQQQLEADLGRAWARDPTVMPEAEVTRRLRGEIERVNELQRKNKNWCPGWESNPHEEKSPEDFKFHSNEKSTTYTERDELRPNATKCKVDLGLGVKRGKR